MYQWRGFTCEGLAWLRRATFVSGRDTPRSPAVEICADLRQPFAGELRFLAARRSIRDVAVAHRSRIIVLCLDGRSQRHVEFRDRHVEGDLGGLHRQDAADTQYRSGENTR